jgi:hypothetical protein
VFQRSDLAGRELVWLLDLTLGGRVIYLAKQAEEVTVEGETFSYLAGLDWGSSIADGFDLFADSPSLRQASLTLYLEGIEDIPTLIAEGHDLSAATGKLWLWAKGTGDRVLFIDGPVANPEYGASDEPVTLTLEELPFEDNALFPPSTARVVSDTWSNFVEDFDQEFYPWIIGHPGIAPALPAAIRATGSPVYIVDKVAYTVLVAGHPVDIQADVTLFNLSSDPVDTATNNLVAYEDDSGRSVTVTELSCFDDGSPGWTPDLEAEYWCSWPTTQGGVIGHDGSAIRGAGEVLRWALEQSTVRWDRGRVAAIIPELAGFKIDAAIVAGPDSRFSPLSWVEEHLLPILPVSARVGPEGLYFVPFNYEADANDAVADISADRREMLRDAAVLYSSRDNIVNEFRLEYSFNADSDKPTSTFTLTGSDQTLDDVYNAIPNLSCRISHTRFGYRREDLSTSVVYDSATAGKICLWRAAAFALPSRQLSYRVRKDFGHLVPGNVVTLTDSEIGLDSQVCLVDQVDWSEDAWLGFTFRAIDVPGRDSF